MRSHLLSVEKILFDEILSVRSVSDTNSKRIQELSTSGPQSAIQVISQQQKSQNRGTEESRDAASTQPPSSPGEHDDQSSQISDPSYTQLMRGVDTQATDQAKSQADPNESADTDSSSDDDSSHDSPKEPKSNDKGTSPGIVGFGKSSNERSRLSSKTRSKSDIKKPTPRPKQEKVKDMPRQNTSESEMSDNDGYIKVEKRKNKRKENNPPKSFGLQGRKQESFEELYLSNIAKCDNQSHKDIANEIRDFCKKQKLRVMSVWVVPNRVTDDTVGCKIRVPLRQVDDMLDGRMWPSDITCKRWRKKPPPPDEPTEQYDRARPRNRDSFRGSRRSSRSYSRGSSSRATAGSRSRSASNHSRKPYGHSSRSRSHSNRRHHDWFDGHSTRS